MSSAPLAPIRFVIATIEERPCDASPACGRPHEVTVYRLADGSPVEHLAVGDAYFEPWAARRHARERTHSCAWDDCNGQHLIVVLPSVYAGKPRVYDGWSPDSRASNCTLPSDRLHRCWVRHGDVTKDPSSLHVDKAGRTCAAGAGSIQLTGWHGYVDRGAVRVERLR